MFPRRRSLLRRPDRNAVGALLALLAAVVPASLPAQGLIRLQAGAGELAAEIRRDSRGYADGDGTREASYREWLRIPIAGSLPSPQLFSYSAVWRPLFGQQTGSGLARRFLSQGSGLDLSVSALQSRYGGLNLFATRHQGSADGGLGGESFYTTRARGLTARVVTRFIPVTIDANERTTSDMWRGAFDDAPFERSERLRSLRFVAAGSKTSVHAERQSYRDLLGPTSFESALATFDHRARWGRGSSLESTIELSDRSGYDPFRRSTWSERLQLQHSRSLFSNWRLNRRSSVTYGVPSNGGSAGGGVRMELARWLSSSVQADRSSSHFPTGSSLSSSISPRLAARHQLRPGAWLNASTSASVESIRRDMAAGEFADAEEERHRVEASRVVQLERINVDIGSIVVRSADQTRTYRTPEDYRVIALGPVARVQFPAGSPVAAGDIVVVLYRYLLLQRTPYRVLGLNAEASVTSRGMSARHSISSRDVYSGGDDPLTIPEQGVDENTGLSLTRSFGVGSLTLDLERRRRSRSVADHAVREVRVLMVPQPRRTMTASFGATATQTTTAGRGIGVVSGNAALGWVPASTFRLQTSLDSWVWRLSDAPAERFTGLSMHVWWRLGQLDTEWRYGYQLRDQLVRGIEHRMWARLVRRF